MTADIVNLRRARKAKARTAREQQAEANRLKFGRSRAERDRDRQQAGLEQRRLDGAALAPDPSEAGTGDPVVDPARPPR